MGKGETSRNSSMAPKQAPVGPEVAGVDRRGARGRWQGFTDVFSTQASDTTASAQPGKHTMSSNDEFELLDRNFVEESEPQSPRGAQHSRALDPEGYHEPHGDGT